MQIKTVSSNKELYNNINNNNSNYDLISGNWNPIYLEDCMMTNPNPNDDKSNWNPIYLEDCMMTNPNMMQTSSCSACAFASSEKDCIDEIGLWGISGIFADAIFSSQSPQQLSPPEEDGGLDLVRFPSWRIWLGWIPPTFNALAALNIWWPFKAPPSAVCACVLR